MGVAKSRCRSNGQSSKLEMKKSSFFIFLLVSIFSFQTTFAANLRFDPTTIPEWKKGTFVFGIAFSTLLASKLALENPKICRWCQPTPFEKTISDNTIWRVPQDAALLSDVFAYGVLPGLGVLVGVYDFERPSDAAVNVFTLINTALFTYSISEVIKRSTVRARPTLGDTDENLSFLSGHTSTAFAFATASSWLAFKRHYNWAPFVVFIGGLAASSTAYLRIAAGKHWFSDVAAGAALGILTGSFVPLFTFANVTPMPEGDGVMLSWNW